MCPSYRKVGSDKCSSSSQSSDWERHFSWLIAGHRWDEWRSFQLMSQIGLLVLWPHGTWRKTESPLQGRAGALRAGATLFPVCHIPEVHVSKETEEFALPHQHCCILEHLSFVLHYTWLRILLWEVPCWVLWFQSWARMLLAPLKLGVSGKAVL